MPLHLLAWRLTDHGPLMAHKIGGRSPWALPSVLSPMNSMKPVDALGGYPLLFHVFLVWSPDLQTHGVSDPLFSPNLGPWRITSLTFRSTILCSKLTGLRRVSITPIETPFFFLSRVTNLYSHLDVIFGSRTTHFFMQSFSGIAKCWFFQLVSFLFLHIYF